MFKKKIFLLVAIITVITILFFAIWFCPIKQKPIERNPNLGIGKHATDQYIDGKAVNNTGLADNEREDINSQTIEKENKIRDSADGEEKYEF